MHDLTSDRIEAMQPIARCEPQHAVVVLRNVHHGLTEPRHCTSLDFIVSKMLRSRIKAIEHLVASNPKIAGMILEQRKNKSAGQAVEIVRIVHIEAELIAIITVESMLRAEPHKSLIILDNLRNPRLRKSIQR